MFEKWPLKMCGVLGKPRLVFNPGYLDKEISFREYALGNFMVEVASMTSHRDHMYHLVYQCEQKCL